MSSKWAQRSSVSCVSGVSCRVAKALLDRHQGVRHPVQKADVGARGRQHAGICEIVAIGVTLGRPPEQVVHGVLTVTQRLRHGGEVGDGGQPDDGIDDRSGLGGRRPQPEVATGAVTHDDAPRGSRVVLDDLAQPQADVVEGRRPPAAASDPSVLEQHDGRPERRQLTGQTSTVDSVVALLPEAAVQHHDQRRLWFTGKDLGDLVGVIAVRDHDRRRRGRTRQDRPVFREHGATLSVR